MDTSDHTMQALFLQLGLPHQPDDIQSFIERHKGLPSTVSLEEADFWSPSQAAFLREAIEQDSVWCETVDQLDSDLRS